MTTQEAIKKIIDAAVNDDYTAVEKVTYQLVMSAYIFGYEDGVDAAQEILRGGNPLTPQESFDKRYKTT